jgi:hypothetical protein
MSSSDPRLKFFAFMSGRWGRLTRIAVGGFLVTAAWIDGGWAWLVAVPGAAMLLSGIFNYCPSGAMLNDSSERSEFMASLKTTNLLKK